MFADILAIANASPDNQQAKILELYPKRLPGWWLERHPEWFGARSLEHRHNQSVQLQPENPEALEP